MILWAPKHIGVGWVAGQGKATSIKEEKGWFRYHTADAETFSEWGWQWAPWNPTFDGTDFAPYSSIDIDLRMSGPKMPPDLLLSLASPGDHHTTPRDSLFKRDKKLSDGKWHRIRVPLKDFADSKTKYDAAHTIQIILGVWNGKGGDFTVDIREICVRK